MPVLRSRGEDAPWPSTEVNILLEFVVPKRVSQFKRPKYELKYLNSNFPLFDIANSLVKTFVLSKGMRKIGQNCINSLSTFQSSGSRSKSVYCECVILV